MFEGFDGWLRAKDENGEAKPYTVTEFVNRCNFCLERELADVEVEGEVASFKVNQNKWVFFDLKEGETSVNCFMVKGQLTAALQDGMKVRVRATPKLTRWGRFSLTVRRVQPVGEGDIKKNFELLKKKLAAEGLFDPAKKRPLPATITKIGVISSQGAAGYIDFLKILDNRWGGLEVQTINTQVQGLGAAEQIMRAITAFNERGEVDVIAILRGGGSADDLAAFNDEGLARAIAASKIVVITGIGHEIDESLADLAADVRASTPSNAAERLTPDKNAMIRQLRFRVSEAKRVILEKIELQRKELTRKITDARAEILRQIDRAMRAVEQTRKLLRSLDPSEVLRRGYAIVTGNITPHTEIEIITSSEKIKAEVLDVKKY